MSEAFVYEWTDHYNGMFYVGFHKGSPDDGYIGSGKDFLKAYNKNPHLFTREIIAFGSLKVMAELERKLLKKNNARNNPLYYNLTNSGFCEMPESAIIKRNKTNTGKKKKNHTEEAKLKMSLSSRGVFHSADTKKKMSKSHSGKTIPLETRAKMSASAKIRPKLKCPYCEKEGSRPQMIQWHFDKCKDNT